MLKENTWNKHKMGGKLEKRWTGPFIIHKDLGKGRYCLKTLLGHPLCLPKTTNSSVAKESSAKLTYMGGDEMVAVNKVTVVPMKKILVMMTVNKTIMTACGANIKDDVMVTVNKVIVVPIKK